MGNQVQHAYRELCPPSHCLLVLLGTEQGLRVVLVPPVVEAASVAQVLVLPL
jgi:hypothetical protein